MLRSRDMQPTARRKISQENSGNKEVMELEEKDFSGNYHNYAHTFQGFKRKYEKRDQRNFF